MGFTVHGGRLQRSDDRLPHPGLEVERSVHGPVLGAGALQRLHLRSLNFNDPLEAQPLHSDAGFNGINTVS
jgi:hypothetical protein